jgi:hypothetical protein
MSQSPVATITYKPRRPSSTSKSGRRQFRSCDQCRKGKRACDIAIPDGFVAAAGVLTPSESCSNCAKTRKACTIEWLSSASQSLQQSKRPRLSTELSQQTPAAAMFTDWRGMSRDELDTAGATPNPNVSSELSQTSEHSLLYTEGFQQQQNFPDPADILLLPEDIPQDYSQVDSSGNLLWDPEAFLNIWNGSGNAINLTIDPPSHIITPPTDDTLFSTGTLVPALKDPLLDNRQRKSRKRLRHRSPMPKITELRRPYEFDPSSTALEYRLGMSHTKSSISGGLMKIYHDSKHNPLNLNLTL